MCLENEIRTLKRAVAVQRRILGAVLALGLVAMTVGFVGPLSPPDPEAFKVTTPNVAGSATNRLQISGNEDTSSVCVVNSKLGVGTTAPATDVVIQRSDATAYANYIPTIADTHYALINTAAGANVFGGFQINNSGNSQNRICAIGGISESTSNRKMSLVFCTDDTGSRTEKLRITGDGNVGIGATAPAGRLDVTGGDSYLRGSCFLGDGTTGEQDLHINALTNPVIRWQRGGTNKWGVIENYNTTDDWSLYSYAAATPGTKFVITKDGNVGVGATNPVTGFEFLKSGATYWNGTNHDWGGTTTPPQALCISNSYNGGYDPVLIFRQATSTGNLKTAGAVDMIGNSSWTDSDNTTQISDMLFILRDNAATLQERMRIRYNGNVGIGKTNPSTALDVNGTITGTTKNFSIPHPLEQGKLLVHSCLEGPECAVYYRGRGKLVDGAAKVTLPAYFNALTRDKSYTVQLTAKGRKPFLLSYEDFDETSFMVYGTDKDGEFDWEVRAIRADVPELSCEPQVDSSPSVFEKPVGK